MKFIVIGLGSFGHNLAEKLTLMGHEVFAVDINQERVEAIKEKVAFAVCMNCKDPEAVKSLPLGTTDVAIVAIGEDEGSNIIVSALLKKMGVHRLVSRSASPLHENILEAMGITEIARPEEESADRWAKKLTMKELVDPLEEVSDYVVIQVKVPEFAVGKTIGELDLNKEYNVLILSVLRLEDARNLLGIKRTVRKNLGIATADTQLQYNDKLVVYGNEKDIKAFLKAIE